MTYPLPWIVHLQQVFGFLGTIAQNSLGYRNEQCQGFALNIEYGYELYRWWDLSFALGSHVQLSWLKSYNLHNHLFSYCLELFKDACLYGKSNPKEMIYRVLPIFKEFQTHFLKHPVYICFTAQKQICSYICFLNQSMQALCMQSCKPLNRQNKANKHA